MDGQILQLLLGFGGIIIGVLSIKKVADKHKKIDTESIAVVECVEVLGKTIGSKTYAITYDVKASEPFKLLDYPCQKQTPIGYERGIFYEKENPQKNYYFKSVGQFDSRLITPIIITVIGMIVVISQLFC